MRARKPASVLLLGSAALKIGEAGEFDYSGSQAIKALRSEGIRTILVNPNIATVQTSERFADEVYFLPVTPEFVEKVIEKERPDGILLGFGGQTALNCGVTLSSTGVLDRFGVSVLGTPVETILDTEDRQRFAARLASIGVPTPNARTATTVEEAVEAASVTGYPCMLRAAFALGGLGSGMCRDEESLALRAGRALAHSPQVLVEECLHGWKEIEYEVVRDSADNCITVCSMENFDPLGIHTGESIVVAPVQTLSDPEHQLLRETAIRVVRLLGVVGECNIQYALSPSGEGFRVIEINARLSRSSALASKATGYPLALVAARLALGMSLTEIDNKVTGVTRACFEPALDYVVVKVPRWDFGKFRGASDRIGSSMKSVGEVMAIGRNFEEALQKALRMVETGARGAVLNEGQADWDIGRELSEPGENRVFAIAQALRDGMCVEEVHRLTSIDPWFLEKLASISRMEGRLREAGGEGLGGDLLRDAKRLGFSDAQIAEAISQPEQSVQALRRASGIRPAVRQIDTLAGEYPASTNYLYLTYDGMGDDVDFGSEGSVLVLGPGTFRIGSSVEFDWCCVSAARTLRELGCRTLMLNNNPETVSTDYDECDRLYFDEISLETISEIYALEKPLGLLLCMGGQIPNNLALKCRREGMRVLGTSPADIDRAEDRHKFSSLLAGLGILQPEWSELTTLEEARALASRAGYPVMIRPSYVLSGAAMAVAGNESELALYLGRAASISREHPAVVSKFMENAKEIDVDAVARDGKLVCWAVSEHVENAGVHSGDATLVLPPQRIYLETIRQVRRVTEQVAAGLGITGPFNIQFLARNNQVMVIECNLRASRSLPFVSKVTGYNFADAATRVILGRPLRGGAPPPSFLDLDYVGVKAPQFSFTRLEGADPTPGVEMTSTGEVACLGRDFDEAFLKALISVGYRLPIRSVLLSTGPVESKAGFLEGTRRFADLGVKIYATRGTAGFLGGLGFDVETLLWPLEGGTPNAIDYIRERKLDLVINIPKHFQREELANDYLIRRAAVDYGVRLVTNLQLAQRLAEAISGQGPQSLEAGSWSTYTDRKA